MQLYLYPARPLGCLCFSISPSRNGSLHEFSSVFRDSGACFHWANFSASSAVPQTVLELLDVVLQKGSPEQFSGILWFFKWGLLALVFVYTWWWLLAVVKSQQKQQMLRTSKTWLLNCLHLGWVYICVLFRWAGRAHHHLPLHICGSLGLFSWWVGCCWCIPKFCLLMGIQSPSWACLPWLLMLEMSWHLQLKLSVYLPPSGHAYFVCICRCFPCSFCCLMFFDSSHLSQLPCLFSQGIPRAAHSNVFSRLGIAANHRCYLFDAKIMAALCELVPAPETSFQKQWTGRDHHQRFLLQSVLNMFIFWGGTNCEHFEAAPNSGWNIWCCS